MGKIKQGDYVYRRDSGTYWKVLYYLGEVGSKRGPYVRVIKVLEKTLRKNENPLYTDVAIGAFDFVDEEFYLSKGYFQKEGPLWDLVVSNEQSRGRLLPPQREIKRNKPFIFLDNGHG